MPRLPNFVPVDLVAGSAVLGSIGAFMVFEVLRLSRRSSVDPIRAAGYGAGYGGGAAVLWWALYTFGQVLS